MINYMEANCIVPPLNSHPRYDAGSGTWGVWFEEKEGANPYNLPSEPICISLETLEEAQELIRKAVELSYKEINNEEPNQ